MEDFIENQSYFDGGLFGLVCVNIGMALITLCTLGIAYPWAKCFQLSWITSHTVLNGRRLHFDGKGGQLFGNYIKWFLLTIITFGIYGFWLAIKMKQWEIKHTQL